METDPQVQMNEPVNQDLWKKAVYISNSADSHQQLS